MCMNVCCVNYSIISYPLYFYNGFWWFCLRLLSTPTNIKCITTAFVSIIASEQRNARPPNEFSQSRQHIVSMPEPYPTCENSHWMTSWVSRHLLVTLSFALVGASTVEALSTCSMQFVYLAHLMQNFVIEFTFVCWFLNLFTDWIPSHSLPVSLF